MSSSNFFFDLGMARIMNSRFDISRFAVKPFTPIKLPVRTMDIRFIVAENAKFHAATPHEQLNCPDVVLPFARGPAAAVPVSDAVTLVDADEKTHVKHTVEIALDTTTLGAINLQPGDTIGVLPRNSARDVQDMLDALHLTDKADVPCQMVVYPISNHKLPAHIPKVTTARLLLQDCLNLRTVLKKQFLRALAEFCSNDNERTFFLSISSREGKIRYNEVVVEKGFTLINILRLCPSCRPPLALLVEHLQRLLPRPYSISNSPLAQRDEIKIVFSILPQRPGVTTSMLDSIAKHLHSEEFQSNINERIPPSIVMYHRKTNQFRFHKADLFKNQILIGIGTSVAPFIGFLEYKEFSGADGHKRPLGETWLIAGAKTAASMLHRDRLLEWQKRNVLNRYNECFSRSPDAPHRYVQDLLDAHSAKFVEQLMHADTTLYVCADGAQISKAIELGIATCLRRELQLSYPEVEQMIKHQREEGKYCEDTWL